MNGNSPVSRSRWPGRILPREKGSPSLDLVIAIMGFLAALALGGVLISERSAQSWESGLTGRLTVQILPQGEAPPQNEVNAALGILKSTPGVVNAAVLSNEENLALVEPWLGRDAAVAALPFPRLIDVKLAPGAAPDIGMLERRLRAAAPHAVLDDHRRWIGRLRTASDTVVLTALLILGLIAMATAATVAFATRAGLAAHRNVVELLHLMGARDRFIARAFERYYFLSALLTAAFGAALAAAAFVAAGGLDRLGIAGGSFLPPLGLTLDELPWLALVPIGAAIISWATARASVIGALRELY